MSSADEAGGDNSDILCFTPLGSGQEVGRSCHLLQFKGKRVLLDCGVHPGMHGVDALPFVDFIEVEHIDLLLITHYHLDHCGALPWLLEKTAFRGKCFMTHATKAIYRMMLGDYIKVAKYGGGNDRSMLYTEEDLDKSMEKIEVIDFHEQKEVNGIRFWPYVAGHVLGACMFMVEIAGVRVLYTGDFSCLEDRHLCAAELPSVSPDVLISESTYGTQVHEERDEREKRFTQMVHEIVGRGGRCLIPAFALGRAQELSLILDEYWEEHPELHDIPVYYASSLAKKCMAVYQTFVSGMNQRIQKQISSANNPFVFKHVSNLKGMEHFEDVGPCVILASPGMLQNGLSRDLFERWCVDSKNGCIIAGYCVEGTLAKYILSEPEEIQALSGERLPMRMQVGYISFSAHTDFQQTTNFVRELRPPHLILVHGEMHEMNRLKAGIERQFEDENIPIEIHNPRNTEQIQLHFRGEKTAKVVGRMAIRLPKDGDMVSGIVVKRNFNYHIMTPEDLSGYTDLSSSKLTQKVSSYYSNGLPLLLFNLRQLNDDALLTAELKPSDPTTPTHIITVFEGAITVQWLALSSVCLVEWESNPVYDMYADAVLAAILHAQVNPVPEKSLPKLEMFPTIEQALVTTMEEVCGEKCASIGPEGVTVLFGTESATIQQGGSKIDCDDPLMGHLLHSIASKMKQCVAPQSMEID